MNCHREPCPVSRKSLAGCPDQRECRWLAIRCAVEQESYMRGRGNETHDLAWFRAPSKNDAANKQPEFRWTSNVCAFDEWFVTKRCARNF